MSTLHQTASDHTETFNIYQARCYLSTFSYLPENPSLPALTNPVRKSASSPKTKALRYLPRTLSHPSRLTAPRFPSLTLTNRIRRTSTWQRPCRLWDLNRDLRWTRRRRRSRFHTSKRRRNRSKHFTVLVETTIFCLDGRGGRLEGRICLTDSVEAHWGRVADGGDFGAFGGG